MKIMYISISTLLTIAYFNPKSDTENAKLIETINYQQSIINTLQDDNVFLMKQIEHQKKLNNVLPLSKPLKNNKITSNFAYRKHPIHDKWKHHNGVDLKAKKGTVVYATGDGYVRKLNRSGYGKHVIIEHKINDYDSGFETVYAHLDKFLIKDGEYVRKGQPIALTGSTGVATGPHLHYEIRKNGVAINPNIFHERDG